MDIREKEWGTEIVYIDEPEMRRKEIVKELWKSVRTYKKISKEEGEKMRITCLIFGKRYWDALKKEPKFVKSGSTCGNYGGTRIRFSKDYNEKEIMFCSEITHVTIIGNPSKRKTKKWHKIKTLSKQEKTSPLGHCKDCNSYRVTIGGNYDGVYEAGTCLKCDSSNTKLVECCICGTQVKGTITRHKNKNLTITYKRQNGKYICLKCNQNPNRRKI